MFDIGNSVTWKNSASVSACLIRELGHGPFKIIGNKFRGYRNIEYHVPLKKRRKTGKIMGTAMVPNGLLEKV